LRPDISIVVPFLDECESLAELHRELVEVLDRLAAYEVILVDDGSTDDSWAVAKALAEEHRETIAIRLRRNFGKAAALDAGFREARGHRVVTLDADLQDPPDQIPLLLAKLDEGWDHVSGWKVSRQDPLTKRLPSGLFNRVIRSTTGIQLHDFNCGLKAYTAEAIEGLRLYGELHRFIPVLVSSLGFSVTEIPVAHRPRIHGKSKYGVRRLAKGALDFVSIVLMTRFNARPLHLIGGTGLGFCFIGAAILTYLAILWLQGVRPIGTRPLFFLGILLVLVGVQLLGTGLVAELVVQSDLITRRAYEVGDIHGRRP
jgi:glycosyltransferase involved in cell wall biosynthesis